jgi:hypothetical protein
MLVTPAVMPTAALSGATTCRLCAALLVLHVLAAPALAGQRAPVRTRQKPPAILPCSTNELTSYTGRVIGYGRQVGRTTLRIKTDWDTLERVTLTHPGTDDPSAKFTIAGAAFDADDWSLIERSKGVLRTGVRATAWVCSNGETVVDWERPAP